MTVQQPSPHKRTLHRALDYDRMYPQADTPPTVTAEQPVTAWWQQERPWRPGVDAN